MEKEECRERCVNQHRNITGGRKGGMLCAYKSEPHHDEPEDQPVLLRDGIVLGPQTWLLHHLKKKISSKDA
jgi:hypothetical protein